MKSNIWAWVTISVARSAGREGGLVQRQGDSVEITGVQEFLYLTLILVRSN